MNWIVLRLGHALQSFVIHNSSILTSDALTDRRVYLVACERVYSDCNS